MSVAIGARHPETGALTPLIAAAPKRLALVLGADLPATGGGTPGAFDFSLATNSGLLLLLEDF